jgi:hypothetical protein
MDAAAAARAAARRKAALASRRVKTHVRPSSDVRGARTSTRMTMGQWPIYSEEETWQLR